MRDILKENRDKKSFLILPIRKTDINLITYPVNSRTYHFTHTYTHYLFKRFSCNILCQVLVRHRTRLFPHKREIRFGKEKRDALYPRSRSSSSTRRKWTRSILYVIHEWFISWNGQLDIVTTSAAQKQARRKRANPFLRGLDPRENLRAVIYTAVKRDNADRDIFVHRCNRCWPPFNTRLFINEQLLSKPLTKVEKFHRSKFVDSFQRNRTDYSWMTKIG